MAKQIIHKLIDDIDGGKADETVKFGVDGSNYEIDLSKKNADKLRDALAPFVGAGSKVSRGGVVAGSRGVRRDGGSPAADRQQNKAIREWAKSEGKEISDRGRIPQEIVEEYTAGGRGSRKVDFSS